MNTKNKVAEKAEMVINALDYAHERKLDINDEDDVKKILEVLDPEHTSKKEVEKFVKLLQNADMFMDITASRFAKKKKIPN